MCKSCAIRLGGWINLKGMTMTAVTATCTQNELNDLVHDFELPKVKAKLLACEMKVSLKAVLLHSENVLPSIPVAHAFGIKESGDSMKQLLQYIKYDTYKWNICADLKVIALLLGLQLG